MNLVENTYFDATNNADSGKKVQNLVKGLFLDISSSIFRSTKKVTLHDLKAVVSEYEPGLTSPDRSQRH